MNQRVQSQAEIKAIVAMGRNVMLMEPVAIEFNELLMAEPVRRVMLVAEILNRVKSKNETISEMMEKQGTMLSLFNESKRRGSGEISVPSAFLADLVGNKAAREASHV